MNVFKKSRKLQESYLIVVLTLAIVIVTNYIATQRFIRVDLTKNQLYAISDASEKIVSELDDIVTIKVFFSQELPPNLFAVKQYVQDILGELSSYSKGNLNIQFLNPNLPEVENEALELGIPQIQMNIVEKDKLEVKNGFLGIAIQYGEKIELLPVIQNILNVEYDLVAGIKKVTAENEKIVGFLNGYGEPKLDKSIKINEDTETLSLLRQALDRNYRVKNVNLNSNNALSGIDTLVVIGSKNKMNQKEINLIHNFVDSGGNLVLMADPLLITGDLQIEKNQFNANDIIRKYGINVEEILVLDRSNERASFNQGFMSFVLPYPLWIKALNENFHPSNPIVANLDSAVFPWTSPLKINKDIKQTSLIQTTENAWSNRAPFQLEPNLIQNSKDKDQFLISTLVKPNSNSGHLFIVGNSRFITDRFIQMYEQNLLFFMNAIDFLTLDSSLINIRSKSSFEIPLKELNIRERQLVKTIGTFLMPLLVIIFGISRFFMRRKVLNNIKW